MNPKAIKLGVKLDDYPKIIFEKIGKVVKDIEKSSKEVPKNLKEWKTYSEAFGGSLTQHALKLRDMESRYDRIKSRMEDMNSEQRLQARQELESLDQKIEKESKVYSVMKQQHEAMKSMLKIESQKSEHGWLRFGTDLKHGWVSGGISGAADAMLHSTIGKLGIAGAVGYGAYKSIHFLGELGEQATQLRKTGMNEGQRFGRGNLVDAIRKSSINEYGLSDAEMRELTSVIARSTGGRAGFSRGSRDSAAKFMVSQGLSMNEMGAIYGLGKQFNFQGESQSNMAAFSNVFATASSRGFDKSDRIAQMTKILDQSSKYLGYLSENEVRFSAQFVDRLESTFKSFPWMRGEGAIQGVAMAREMFNPEGGRAGILDIMTQMGFVNTNVQKNARDQAMSMVGGEQNFRQLDLIQQRTLEMRAIAASSDALQSIFETAAKKAQAEGTLGQTSRILSGFLGNEDSTQIMQKLLLPILESQKPDFSKVRQPEIMDEHLRQDLVTKNELLRSEEALKDSFMGMAKELTKANTAIVEFTDRLNKTTGASATITHAMESALGGKDGNKNFKDEMKTTMDYYSGLWHR